MDQYITHVGKGVFESLADVEHCVTARSRWLLDTLWTLIGSSTKQHITEDIHMFLNVLRDNMETEVASCDALLGTDKEKWKTWWVKIIMMGKSGKEHPQMTAELKALARDLRTEFGQSSHKTQEASAPALAPAAETQQPAGPEIPVLSLAKPSFSETADGPVVFAFMTQLTAFITSTIVLGVSRGEGVPSVCSQALGKVGHFPNNTRLYCTLPFAGNLRLPFHGPISRIPSKGSLVVATAFDTVFYMQPSIAPPGSDGSCPAWSVEVATGKKDAPEANLRVVTVQAEMPFAWKELLEEKEMKVPVTFYALEPKQKKLKDTEELVETLIPHADGTSLKGKAVKLLREMIPCQQKTVPKTKAKAKAKASEVVQAKWLLK